MDNKLQEAKEKISKAKTDQAVIESQIKTVQEEMKTKFDISSFDDAEIEINKRSKNLNKIENDFDMELSKFENEFPWED